MTDRPDPDADTNRREQASSIGLVTGFAWSIVVVLLVFIGGGIFLDQLLDTTPVLTLIGIVLGLVGAGYQLYELTLLGQKNRPAGPIGRRLERRTGTRDSGPSGRQD